MHLLGRHTSNACTHWRRLGRRDNIKRGERRLMAYSRFPLRRSHHTHPFRDRHTDSWETKMARRASSVVEGLEGRALLPSLAYSLTTVRRPRVSTGRWASRRGTRRLTHPMARPQPRAGPSRFAPWRRIGFVSPDCRRRDRTVCRFTV
jgi:hypothetical protein